MFLENTVNPKEQFGWIEVICGSMFSGKTEELIRRLKRAQFAKQKVEIFKPAVDVRYDDEMINFAFGSLITLELIKKIYPSLFILIFCSIVTNPKNN